MVELGEEVEGAGQVPAPSDCPARSRRAEVFGSPLQGKIRNEAGAQRHEISCLYFVVLPAGVWQKLRLSTPAQDLEWRAVETRDLVSLLRRFEDGVAGRLSKHGGLLQAGGQATQAGGHL